MINAFNRRGAAAEVVTVEALIGSPGMPKKEASLLDYDGLLIRGIPGGSLEQVIYRMDALYALERKGLPCVNSPKTIEKTVDKYFTSALLDEAKLPVPPTVCCESNRRRQTRFLHSVAISCISRCSVPAEMDCFVCKAKRKLRRHFRRLPNRAACSICRNSSHPATVISARLW
jgi:hypothetical protein